MFVKFKDYRTIYRHRSLRLLKTMDAFISNKMTKKSKKRKQKKNVIDDTINIMNYLDRNNNTKGNYFSVLDDSSDINVKNVKIENNKLIKPKKTNKIPKYYPDPIFDTLPTINQDQHILTDLIVSNNLASPLKFLGKYEQLYKIKVNLDSINNITWMKFRNLCNEFELISTKGRKIENKIYSIPQISVISRAYFKLWEILKHYESDLLPLNKDVITYVGLAEGPGGFAQAIMDLRKGYYNDKFCGISLRDGTGDTTRWAQKISNNNEFMICYGDPEYDDGNLLNPKNIKAFSNFVDDLSEGNKADIITADGGLMIDEDKDGPFKEQYHLPLFFNEVLSALAIQAVGGCYIMKIYDILTKPTVQLIYILSLYYEHVNIFKPLSSRPANSEKYLVCTGFKGIDHNSLDGLFEISKRLFDSPTEHIKSLIKNNIELEYAKKISQFNSRYIDSQINSIKKILHAMYLSKKDKNVFYQFKDNCIDDLHRFGRYWCQQHNISYKTQ